jgi:hypothetical protein
MSVGAANVSSRSLFSVVAGLIHISLLKQNVERPVR